jgi:hypothetical protein
MNELEELLIYGGSTGTSLTPTSGTEPGWSAPGRTPQWPISPVTESNS